MAAFVGDDSAFDCPADEGQVAYQVHDFVPDAFIREPVRVFDGAVGIDDEDVPRGQMDSHTASLKLQGFGFEKKCPGSSEIFFKIVGGKTEAENLPADTGVAAVVEVVCDIESVVGVRQGVNGGVAGGYGDWVFNCELISG